MHTVPSPTRWCSRETLTHEAIISLGLMVIEYQAILASGYHEHRSSWTLKLHNPSSVKKKIKHQIITWGCPICFVKIRALRAADISIVLALGLVVVCVYAHYWQTGTEDGWGNIPIKEETLLLCDLHWWAGHNSQAGGFYFIEYWCRFHTLVIRKDVACQFCGRGLFCRANPWFPCTDCIISCQSR